MDLSLSLEKVKGKSLSSFKSRKEELELEELSSELLDELSVELLDELNPALDSEELEDEPELELELNNSLELEELSSELDELEELLAIIVYLLIV